MIRFLSLNMNLKLNAGFLLFFLIVGREASPQNGSVKAEAVKKYKNEYVESQINGIKWKGNIERCVEGTIPKDIRAKALLRINYFRTICGLPLLT